MKELSLVGVYFTLDFIKQTEAPRVFNLVFNFNTVIIENSAFVFTRVRILINY